MQLRLRIQILWTAIRVLDPLEIELGIYYTARERKRKEHREEEPFSCLILKEVPREYT